MYIHSKRTSPEQCLVQPTNLNPSDPLEVIPPSRHAPGMGTQSETCGWFSNFLRKAVKKAFRIPYFVASNPSMKWDEYGLVSGNLLHGY